MHTFSKYETQQEIIFEPKIIEKGEKISGSFIGTDGSENKMDFITPKDITVLVKPNENIGVVISPEEANDKDFLKKFEEASKRFTTQGAYERSKKSHFGAAHNTYMRDLSASLNAPRDSRGLPPVELYVNIPADDEQLN